MSLQLVKLYFFFFSGETPINRLTFISVQLYPLFPCLLAPFQFVLKYRCRRHVRKSHVRILNMGEYTLTNGTYHLSHESVRTLQMWETNIYEWELRWNEKILQYPDMRMKTYTETLLSYRGWCQEDWKIRVMSMTGQHLSGSYVLKC